MSDFQHSLSSVYCSCLTMLYHPTPELGPQPLNQALSVPTCFVYTHLKHLILPPSKFLSQ